MKTISVDQVKKEFPMRQDSLTNAQLVIEIANSTRGRNHFKNNYLRHMRLKESFKNVIINATHLISEINQELENIKK